LPAIEGQQRPGVLKLEVETHSSRAAERRSLLVGVGALFSLLAALVAYASDWGMSVVVRDSEGRTTSRYALPGSGEFEIEYVHSYYKAPVTEHFVADEDGGFELFEVSSPSEAVLDYYELEGRKELGYDLLRLVPEEPQRFETLPLIATEKGRRTLIVSGERKPFYKEGGLRHVTIKVEEDAISTELRELLDE
jgi:hypothetical protein